MILSWDYRAHGNKPRRCLGLGYVALFRGVGEEAEVAYSPPQLTVYRVKAGTLSIAREHAGTLTISRQHAGTLEVHQ